VPHREMPSPAAAAPTYDSRPARRRSSEASAVTAIDTAVVVIGGDRLHPVAVAESPAGFTIAADSGLDWALEAGLRPDLVVGDLDSVSEEGLAWARSNGIPVEEHRPDKDSTDTELALAAAVERGANRVVVLSGGGDRLDHSISAISALGHPRLAACGSVSALWGDSLIQVLHGPRDHEFELPLGATFSLLAMHGRCSGVKVEGAQWPLHDAVIEPGTGVGISNVAVCVMVSIAVADGVLTVIVPDHMPVEPRS